MAANEAHSDGVGLADFLAEARDDAHGGHDILLGHKAVMEVTVDSQLPKPSGAKIQASRLPRPAMRLYWI